MKRTWTFVIRETGLFIIYSHFRALGPTRIPVPSSVRGERRRMVCLSIYVDWWWVFSVTEREWLANMCVSIFDRYFLIDWSFIILLLFLIFVLFNYFPIIGIFFEVRCQEFVFPVHETILHKKDAFYKRSFIHAINASII